MLVIAGHRSVVGLCLPGLALIAACFSGRASAQAIVTPAQEPAPSGLPVVYERSGDVLGLEVGGALGLSVGGEDRSSELVEELHGELGPRVDDEPLDERALAAFLEGWVQCARWLRAGVGARADFAPDPALELQLTASVLF